MESNRPESISQGIVRLPEAIRELPIIKKAKLKGSEQNGYCEVSMADIDLKIDIMYPKHY